MHSHVYPGETRNHRTAIHRREINTVHWYWETEIINRDKLVWITHGFFFLLVSVFPKTWPLDFLVKWFNFRYHFILTNVRKTPLWPYTNWINKKITSRTCSVTLRPLCLNNDIMSTWRSIRESLMKNWWTTYFVDINCCVVRLIHFLGVGKGTRRMATLSH